MKAFIALFVVALVGQSMASDLLPKNTPEVEAAKNEHLARWNAEAQRNYFYGNQFYGGPEAYSGIAPIERSGAYYYGAAPLAADGRVVDTPEVAAAKAAHFAEVAKATNMGYAPAPMYQPQYYSSAPPMFQSQAYYSGSQYGSAAPIGRDGTVVDTPEVAQAKAAHFAAVAAAQRY